MNILNLGLLAPGLALSLALSVAPAQSQDEPNEYAEQLTTLGRGAIKDFASDPVVIDAIRAQNLITAGYDQARIDALDKQWRAEVDAADQPLITETMGNPASLYLGGVQEKAAGLYAEVFVTDARGLNVAQSTLTSDYWQGDEGKWSNSFGAGPEGIDIGEIEQDESSQAFQSQVSITITDPDTGEPIGAITVGVDLALI